MLFDAIQMRTHNICLYKKVNKKYTGCKLKTTEIHECALIGICEVIRSNTVISFLLSPQKHNYVITKTYLYNFDPLKSHFYIVKLGFTGVYIIFLISVKNMDYGYLLELPQWGSSNEYPQSMFWAEIQNILWFLSENFQFLVVKFSIYLNRHVFVMAWESSHWAVC